MLEYTIIYYLKLTTKRAVTNILFLELILHETRLRTNRMKFIPFLVFLRPNLMHLPLIVERTLNSKLVHTMERVLLKLNKYSPFVYHVYRSNWRIIWDCRGKRLSYSYTGYRCRHGNGERYAGNRRIIWRFAWSRKNRRGWRMRITRRHRHYSRYEIVECAPRMVILGRCAKG